MNEYGYSMALTTEEFSATKSGIYAVVKALEDYTIINEHRFVPDSEADNYPEPKEAYKGNCRRIHSLSRFNFKECRFKRSCLGDCF